MERDTSEAERDRQAHHKAERARGSAKRSTTASFSSEETARRRNLLCGAEADEVMKSKPRRLPDLVLEGPHEAPIEYHEDWTRVPGSGHDPELWERELRLRDSRNRLIRDNLTGGRSAFYKSSGDSMWPLVQSNDACTIHPIQAVTANGGKYSIQKEASEIDVGDIVFCRVQPKNLFYAHVVLEVSHLPLITKYFIGNIQGRINGYCYREHIFGTLVDVQMFSGREYFSRPHPKELFEKVSALVKDERWSDKARIEGW